MKKLINLKYIPFVIIFYIVYILDSLDILIGTIHPSHLYPLLIITIIFIVIIPQQEKCEHIIKNDENSPAKNWTHAVISSVLIFFLFLVSLLLLRLILSPNSPTNAMERLQRTEPNLLAPVYKDLKTEIFPDAAIIAYQAQDNSIVYALLERRKILWKDIYRIKKYRIFSPNMIRAAQDSILYDSMDETTESFGYEKNKLVCGILPGEDADLTVCNQIPQTERFSISVDEQLIKLTFWYLYWDEGPVSFSLFY